MFDKKTNDAYRKITPSEVCRERILNMEEEHQRKARYPISRRLVASAAAAFILLVCFIGVITPGFLDGSTVSVSDSEGQRLSADLREIAPQSAEYQSELIRRNFNVKPDTPAITVTLKANHCFYFELYSKKTATAVVNAGIILQYDPDKGAYVNAGESASFQGESKVYWFLPEDEVVEPRSMIITAGQEKSEITLKYESESGTYTASYQKIKGND